MKKLTLSIGLVAAILSANAQDTLKYVISGKTCTTFDKNTGEIINVYNGNSFELEICPDYTLELHLNDSKNRLRRVSLICTNGEIIYKNLDSKDNIYYFNQKRTILVDKCKRFIRL